MVDRRAAVDRDLGVDGGQTTTIGLSSARPAVSRVCRDRRIAGYRYATPVDEQTASLSEATVEARTTATAEDIVVDDRRAARQRHVAVLGIDAAPRRSSACAAHAGVAGPNRGSAQQTARERQRCARDVNAAALGVAAASDSGAARGAHRTVLEVDIGERE